MLQLLPEQYKRNIRREYLYRFGITISSVVSVISLLAMTGLIPAYVHMYVSKDKVEQMTAEEKERATVPVAQLVAEKNKLSTMLDYLDSEKRGQMANLAEVVLQSRNAGISVHTMSLSHSSDLLEVAVSGVALDRPSLVAFRDALENSPSIASVEAPVSLFTKDRDITFTFSLIATPLTTP